MDRPDTAVSRRRPHGHDTSAPLTALASDAGGVNRRPGAGGQRETGMRRGAERDSAPGIAGTEGDCWYTIQDITTRCAIIVNSTMKSVGI